MNVRTTTLLSYSFLFLLTLSALPTVHFDNGYIKPKTNDRKAMDSVKSRYRHIQNILNKYRSKKGKRTLQTDLVEQGEPEAETQTDTEPLNTEEDKGDTDPNENTDADEHSEETHEEHETTEDHEVTEEVELTPEEQLKQERDEIKAAVGLIEYKLIEVNELIKECIEEQFTADYMADKLAILKECAGLNYQILFQNYREGMRRVKQIFLEILRRKMKSLDSAYEDEIEFFLDILEDFIDKDLKLKQSLEVSKEAAKYYVSASFYNELLKIADPELSALNAIHQRLHFSRKEVQDLINRKIAEREAYLENLRKEAAKIEVAGEQVSSPNDDEPEASDLSSVPDPHISDSAEESVEDSDEPEMDEDDKYNNGGHNGEDESDEDEGKHKNGKGDDEEEEEDKDDDEVHNEKSGKDNGNVESEGNEGGDEAKPDDGE